MNTVDVVCAVNEAYVQPLATCIHSMARAAAQPKLLRLNVLHAALPDAAVSYLARVVSGSGMHARFISVSPDAVRDFPVSGHVTQETYFRLLAADFLHEAALFVYLDCDTLVLADLCTLASFDLGGAHLAAAVHPALRSAFFASERGIPTYGRYAIAPDARVFNAGVMVIDAGLWRRDRVGARAGEYLRSHRDEVRWWDQDALNVVLHRRWTPLPPGWNVMTSQYCPPFVQEAMAIGPEEYEATLRDPWIVHYTSAAKPWKRGYDGLFREAWHAADFDRVRAHPAAIA